MRKVLLVLCLSVVAGFVFAQNSVNVKVGVNIDRGYRSAATLAPPTNYLFGFYYDYSIKNDLFVRLGFAYNQHTRNLVDKDFTWGTMQRIVTKSSLDVPICLGIKKNIDPFHLYLIGGPYYSYHLQGDNYIKFKGTTVPDKYETIEWGTQGDKWRVWEMGVYGEIGLEYKNFILSCSYMRGLSQQFSAKDAVLKSANVKSSNGTVSTVIYGILPFSDKIFSVNVTYVIPLGTTSHASN